MNKGTSQLNLVVLALVLAFAAVVCLKGAKSNTLLVQKAAAQTSETESVRRWIQSYKALQGTTEEWDKSFLGASKVPDLRALAALIDVSSVGLSAETDKMILGPEGVKQVTATGVPLDLSKICVVTANDKFMVRAPTYQQLLEGVSKLLKRKDVTASSVTISSEHDSPQAGLRDFCVYLRND